MRLARGVLCATLAATCTAPIIAQERRTRDPQMEALLADARAVPPEISADALIRLAGSSRISDARKLELLGEAFMRAYRARDDYRLSSLPAIPRASRQGAERQAYATGLSRVSLQVRAAQLMAFVDPRRGR